MIIILIGIALIVIVVLVTVYSFCCVAGDADEQAGRQEWQVAKTNYHHKNPGTITDELSEKVCPVCGALMIRSNIITPLGFSFFDYRCSSQVCSTRRVKRHG